MRKVFDWLDSRRFSRDWAVANMTKQYLRGRRKQIIKREKETREADANRLAKERRRRQAVLEKRTFIAEDDPEALAIEETNDNNEELDGDPNWPPVRPHKKQHVAPLSPLSSVDSDGHVSEDE